MSETVIQYKLGLPITFKYVRLFPKKEISILLKLLFAQFKLSKLVNASIPVKSEIPTLSMGSRVAKLALIVLIKSLLGILSP